MALSLFLHICPFLILMCYSNGKKILDLGVKLFHESADREELERSRRQSVNETFAQKDRHVVSTTTKIEMASNITWTVQKLVVAMTEKFVPAAIDDNVTDTPLTIATSYTASVNKSFPDIKLDHTTKDAVIQNNLTFIASTLLSTTAMLNSSMQYTSVHTKPTTYTSIISEASTKPTDATFNHSVIALATLVKEWSPSTMSSMLQTTSNLGHDDNRETDFGRYGLLAFGIAIAMVLILMFALVVVMTRQNKTRRKVNIQDEDGSPNLRMLEIPGLGEGKDDGLQTYSLGYDNGNTRASVRPPGGMMTPFAGVTTFMLLKRGSDSSMAGSNIGYVSPRSSTMSPLKESSYEFQPSVSETPSRKGSKRSNQSKKSAKTYEQEQDISEI